MNLIRTGPNESVYLFNDKILKVFQNKYIAKNEIKIQKYASSIGISPKLIAHGEDFLITEFINGTLLEDLPKTPELIESVDKVVDRMHFYGIIHGDLNEGNIMIKDDKIYILDFGSSIYKRFVSQKDLDNDYVMYDY